MDPQLIDTSIDASFIIESHLLSTRSADGYKAIHRDSGVSVCLWKLRHPLALHSDAVKRFLNRLKSIQEISGLSCPMNAFGVDSMGLAFAVFPRVDGDSLIADRIEPNEAERRLIPSLRYVELLHAKGIVCGDICGSSFWVDRGGEVSLVGVMGSFDAEAAATAMLPPMETLHFVAPEQREGGVVEKFSDVFSMGVLAYYLFTRRYPYGEASALIAAPLDIRSVKPPSAFAKVPAWADAVILKALSPEPSMRFPDAGAFLKGVIEFRQEAYTRANTPAKIKSDAQPPRTRAGAKETVPVKNTLKQEAQAAQTPASSRARIFVLVVVGALIFFLTLGIGLKLTRTAHSKVEQKSALQEHVDVMLPAIDNPDQKQSMQNLSQSKVSLAAKEQELEKLAKSDDPLTFAFMVEAAVNAASPQERALAENAILTRAKRINLTRAAEQVTQWLRSVPAGPILPVGYASVLKSLNTSLPPEARTQALLEAYAGNPAVTTRLVAALAIDTDQPEIYQPVLAHCLVGPLGTEDELKLRSAWAMILASPELSLIFGNEVIQNRQKIPDYDIIWLLKILAERNDVQVRSISSLAVDRNVLSPLRNIFLATVRDRTNLPPDILQGLIKASAGALKKEDLSGFGRWYDVESERSLLAICADDYPEDVALEAFDILTGKSLTIEPTASVIDWVRNNKWDKRVKFVQAIGIIGSMNLVDSEKLASALVVFEPYLRDSKLLEIMLATNQPSLVKILLDRYSAAIPLPILLNFLEYPDKDIKIKTLTALVPYHDVVALKIVLDHYDQEKDPEIRKVYEENFWIIRERVKNTNR